LPRTVSLGQTGDPFEGSVGLHACPGIVGQKHASGEASLIARSVADEVLIAFSATSRERMWP
jgi:hypothetical protein